MTKTATPPTTPPMIAPLFEDAALGLSDGVLDGDALAARTEDNAVTPVGSVVVNMSELVETCEIVSATGDVSSSETGGVSEALGVSEPADVVVEVMEAVEDASVDKVVDSDKADVDEAVVVLGVTLGNKSMTPAVVTRVCRRHRPDKSPSYTDHLSSIHESRLPCRHTTAWSQCKY